jgi:hypothetical protein
MPPFKGGMVNPPLPPGCYDERYAVTQLPSGVLDAFRADDPEHVDLTERDFETLFNVRARTQRSHAAVDAPSRWCAVAACARISLSLRDRSLARRSRPAASLPSVFPASSLRVPPARADQIGAH